MISEKSTPSDEPTLMIGDVAKNFDFRFIDNFICNTLPRPVKLRKSATKNEMKINSYYQYSSFDEARIALKILNGAKVPGMPYDFHLDMNFTKQQNETCAHLTVNHLHLNRLEVMKIFTRYISVLGLAQYQFKLWNGMIPKTTCFVRFGDMEECMQAVRELNNIPIESSLIHMTLSARYLDILKNYIVERESVKLQNGIPEFHNVYGKQRVDQRKFNELVVTTSSDFFDDLEGSRWSDVAFQTNVHEKDYNRQITLSRFEHW